MALPDWIHLEVAKTHAYAGQHRVWSTAAVLTGGILIVGGIMIALGPGAVPPGPGRHIGSNPNPDTELMQSVEQTVGIRTAGIALVGIALTSAAVLMILRNRSS